MGLVSFLLHCNASNLVLEILKHDKICGQFVLGFTPSKLKFWGTRSPASPVIYADAVYICKGTFTPDAVRCVAASCGMLRRIRHNMPRNVVRHRNATQHNASGMHHSACK